MSIDEKGMRAAEAWAQWFLGDRSWAGLIVRAYLNPEQAMIDLRVEKGEEEPGEAVALQGEENR